MSQAKHAPTTGPVTRAIMAMRADRHPFHGDALRFHRPAEPEPHLDAALFAHKPALDRMEKRCDEAASEVGRLDYVAYAMVGPAPERHAPECAAWFERLHAAQDECGQTVAYALLSELGNKLTQMLDDLAGVPAKTLDGLIYKARLADLHEFEPLAESIVADLVAMGGRQ